MDYMKYAVKEAEKGISARHGGPFGAVVVLNGEIVGRGHNRVLADNDPTAHGEITAIRDACKNLNTFDLSGAELYTTCYPCPMCLCAMMWANVKTCFYGCTSKDADRIGFRDDNFYGKISDVAFIENFNVKADESSVQDCEKLFNDYLKTNPQLY